MRGLGKSLCCSFGRPPNGLDPCESLLQIRSKYTRPPDLLMTMQGTRVFGADRFSSVYSFFFRQVRGTFPLRDSGQSGVTEMVFVPRHNKDKLCINTTQLGNHHTAFSVGTLQYTPILLVVVLPLANRRWASCCKTCMQSSFLQISESSPFQRS
jgi:hypothetical protein